MSTDTILFNTVPDGTQDPTFTFVNNTVTTSGTTEADVSGLATGSGFYGGIQYFQSHTGPVNIYFSQPVTSVSFEILAYNGTGVNYEFLDSLGDVIGNSSFQGQDLPLRPDTRQVSFSNLAGISEIELTDGFLPEYAAAWEIADLSFSDPPIPRSVATYWNDGVSGDWSTASNWTTGAVPDSTNNVNLPSIYESGYTVSYTNSSNVAVRELNIGSEAVLDFNSPEHTLTVFGITSNTGEIDAQTGSIVFDDDVSNSGSIIAFSGTTITFNGREYNPSYPARDSIEINGGTVVLNASATSPIKFVGYGGMLVVGSAALSTTTSVISGFAPSDVIDLADVPYQAGETASVTNGDVLLITEGGNSYQLNLTGSYSGQSFFVSSDGHSGTDITLSSPTVTTTSPISTPPTVTTTPPTVTTTSPISTPPTVTTPIVVISDFNGDGTSDVLLQNGGTVVDWLMRVGLYSTGNVLTTGAAGYTDVGSGDFNGDGTSDTLLQNGGTVIDWILQNGTYQSGNVITTAAIGFSVVGTGDFNDDGTSDVLLQSGGTVVDWIMQNGAYQSGNVLTTGATGYTVVGAGDFDGDGTSDVLLQNGGTVVDWLMQNGKYQSGNVLTTGATGFTVVGTGDFNGDGTSDVLLQNGGTVVDWIMKNGAYQSGNVLTTGATGFTVVGTGDYNGDGTSDVLLQNGGTVVDWIIKNGAYQSGNVITTAAAGFTICPS